MSLSLNLLSAYPYIYPSIYLSPCYLYIPNPCICLSADTHPIRTCNSLYRSYPHTLIPLTLTPLTGACLRLYGTLYGSTSALYVGMVCYALPYSDARTAGRADACAYGYMLWIDGATRGRAHTLRQSITPHVLGRYQLR